MADWATPADDTNRALTETNKTLVGRLEVVRADATRAHVEVRRLSDERGRTLVDITSLRRDRNEDRSFVSEVRAFRAEVGDLRLERDRL